MTNLKIITAFHGAVIHSNAFQDPEIYVPVYGGRAVSIYLPDRSKAMLADNTGDNISWMNPFIGPFTCVYWASKNLDKIGNPDYIGLNHYRRLFPVRTCLANLLQEKEPFVLTSINKSGIPVMQMAELEYGIQEDLMLTFQAILKTEEEKKIFNDFINQRAHSEKMLFVIPTEDLPGYVEFMMRAVSFLVCYFQYQYLEGMQYRRRPSRIMEYVSAYYMYKLGCLGRKRFAINYEYPWRQFA